MALITVSGDSRGAADAIPEGGWMVERQLAPPLTILNGRLAACIHYCGSDAGNPIEPFLEQARAAAVRLT